MKQFTRIFFGTLALVCVIEFGALALVCAIDAGCVVELGLTREVT